MFFHLYASSAIRPFTQADFHELLLHARLENTQRGITGILLYRDGNFMQLLEGPEEEVRGLVDRIRADVRHRGIVPILEGHQMDRQFPDTSMAFRDLLLHADPDSTETAPHSRADVGSDPTGCRRLLRNFEGHGR